jgi:hypothetical protein
MFLQFPRIYLALEEKEKGKLATVIGPILARMAQQHREARARPRWLFCQKGLRVLTN